MPLTAIPGGPYTIDTSGWASGAWYEREALAAIERGHARGIGSLDGSSLYLLRCWLTTPRVGDDDGFDSAESLLLHRFGRADDDRALHDHPWDFRASIIEGGYEEALPDLDWQPGMPWNSHIWPGPEVGARVVTRRVGDTVQHRATDLHAVTRLHVGVSWSAMRTGPRVREWGFHPPGKPWVPWREYLGIQRPAASASAAP